MKEKLISIIIFKVVIDSQKDKIELINHQKVR